MSKELKKEFLMMNYEGGLSAMKSQKQALLRMQDSGVKAMKIEDIIEFTDQTIEYFNGVLNDES